MNLLTVKLDHQRLNVSNENIKNAPSKARKDLLLTNNDIELTTTDMVNEHRRSQSANKLSREPEFVSKGARQSRRDVVKMLCKYTVSKII